MRVLVTGGSGFVGRQVCEQLSRENDEVVLFDLARPGRELLRGSGGVYFEGDVTSFEDVVECLSKNRVDGIINAAAKILGDQEHPLETFTVNVLGLANVLEAARRLGVERVVSVSTAGVYGKRVDAAPLTEDLPLRPEDTYEHTKAVGEGLARMYVERYGMDVRVIRFPFLYGPGQYVVWPLNIVLYHALAGKPLRLKQGGDYSLEYLYVKDAAAGAVSALRSETARSRVYNIGTGACATVRELAEVARRAFPGFECEVGGGLWPSEVLNAWVRGPLDVSRARVELGYRARFDLERGMRELADWERAHPEEYQGWPGNDLWILP